MITATKHVDHPLGAQTTVLDFYELDYRPSFLAGKQPKQILSYGQAISHLIMANLHGHDPVLADLSDRTIDRLIGWMDGRGYSIKTLEATRWRLRAILRYAASKISGVKPPATARPINAEPLRVKIVDAAEAHRCRLERDKLASSAGKPRRLKKEPSIMRSLGRPEGLPVPEMILPTEGGAIPANTLSQLIVGYLIYAQGYYRGSRETENMAAAAQVLETLYGDELVSAFTPRKLRALQQAMIDGYVRRDGRVMDGLSRQEINNRINRQKRIFRWAVSEELCPPALLTALESVVPLRKHRCGARETPGVEPVAESVVMATIPFMPPVIADMVRVQLLTSARPGEICVMKPAEIDRAGLVWVYKPSRHKTEYRGRGRQIPIGPEAQKILAPYLERDCDSYCFTPRDSECWRKAWMRAARKSKVQPSQVGRSKPETRPGLFYTTATYGHAVRRSCHLAGIKVWSPNRLRHTAATKIRKEFGLEAAQAVLGHARADVTQIYAERNMELAWKVVNKIG